MIEVLIVIVLLGFVLVAAVTFGNGIRVSNESRTLTGEMTDRQTVFTNQIKNDFEAVGYNLKGVFQASASGRVEPIFFASRDYQVTPRGNSANIIRQTSSGETDLLSAWGLVRGSSELSFAPESPTSKSTVGYRDSDNNSYTFYYASLQQWEINIAGSAYSSNQSPEAMFPGDRVTIALDFSEPGGCAMTFYFLRGEERRFLVRRPINCRYQFQAFVNLREGGTITDFTLRGSSFNRLDVDSEAAALPTFPTKSGVSSAVPVWIENNGESFTLLKSDLSADALSTRSPVQINSEYDEVELIVTNPLRGEFTAGDYCLLIDDSAHKSVLGKVLEVTPGTFETVVLFTPSSKEIPAWEDFYSDPSDFISHAFAAPSRVVRLSAPVAYRLAVDNSSGEMPDIDRALFRREGLAPWEKVAFGLTESVLKHDTAAGRNDFVLNFSILPEITTSVDPRPVSINFSPSGLNAR